MAEKSISLIIRAKDGATAVISKMAAGVRGIAAKIGAAFKMAGAAAQGVNAAMEIAGKVTQALGRAYDLTVAKALELRAASDPAKKDFALLGEAVEGIGTGIGDALIPGLRAFAQALTPVIKSAAKWLETNRELIASKFTEFLANTARLLTSGVATAVIYLTRAWYGWLFVVDLVKTAINTAFAAILDASASALTVFAELADRFGEGGLAGNLRGAAEAARGMGAEFTASGDEASRKLAENLGELNAIESAVRLVEGAVDKAIGGAVVRAAKNAKDQIHLLGSEARDLAGDEAWGEIEAAMDAIPRKASELSASRGLDRFFMFRRRELDAVIQQAEETDKLQVAIADLRKEWGSVADAAFAATGSVAGARTALEDARESTKGWVGVAADGISSISSGITTMLDQVIDGTMSAGQIIGGFFAGIGRSILDSIIGVVVEMATTWAAGQIAMAAATKARAVTEIAANTAVAESAAIAAHAGIPFAGIGIGIAAALAIAGVIASIATFAEGGYVTGGTPGRDSVPALVMPGEYITTTAQARENVRAGRAPGDDGGPRRGDSGSRSVTINASVVTPTLIPLSQREVERMAQRQLLPLVRKAVREGRLVLD